MGVIMEINNAASLHQLYPEVKFWLSVGGIFWMAFKGFTWVKAIRDNDLPQIQTGLDDVKKGMESVYTELKTQTSAVVSELQNLRLDFRTYSAPVRTRIRKK